VKEAVIDTFVLTNVGIGHDVELFEGAGCKAAFADVNPPTVGAATISFGAGIAIARGQAISYGLGDSISAEIFLYGYKVPAADVPASTLVATVR